MKKLLLLLILPLLAISGFAQEEKPDTPRDLICEMTKINIPKVADLKSYCSRIDALYPSAQTIAKYPIKKKLYFNKLSGVLKRGSTWDRLTPQQRSTLCESTFGYITTYLGYEPGGKINSPEGFKQTGDPCLLRDVKYENLTACHADAEFIILEDITDNARGSTERFWDCLQYICLVLDCNVNHPEK
jgi:hypothetical protein